MHEFTVEELLSDTSFINYCLSKQASDISFWQKYAQTSPQKAAVVKEAREILLTGNWIMIAEQQKQAEWQRIERKFQFGTTKTYSIWKYIAAASVLIAFIVIYQFINNSSSDFKKETAAIIYTPQQQRKGFSLADSSFVLLDENSELKLVNGFEKGIRVLSLTGMAYFKVAKDSLHPFSVKAGDYVITALGTAFRVSYKNNHLEVLLEEGKVKVEQQVANKLQLLSTLEPGEKLSIQLNKKEMTPIKEVFNSNELKSWKTQELFFENTPLHEVIRQLELCYNIQINTDAAHLAEETFSGHFSNDSLTAILNVLCFSIHKQYEIKNNSQVIIF